MPRTPLTPISSNRANRKELEPFQRGIIVGRFLTGQKMVDIQHAMDLPYSTIQTTITRYQSSTTGTSSPRNGRPEILSQSDKRFILLQIKRDPFIRTEDICKLLPTSISPRTVSRMLKESGYGHWKAQKRPRLTEEAAKLRYEWACIHKDWTYEQWCMVIWSDECSVELGKGKRNEWVWRLNHFSEKWKKKNIVPYTKGKGMSIMIWAAIWGDGSTEIYQMSRDEASTGRGYSSQSYLELIRDYLPAIWRPGMEFMQDNAPIHTARIIKDWFCEHGIPLVDWPPYSPDLNPIEHAWAKLKERIYLIHPELESFGGTKGQLKELFFKAMEDAWESLGQDFFDGLVRSMENRVNAVLEAKGWYTHY